MASNRLRIIIGGAVAIAALGVSGCGSSSEHAGPATSQTAAVEENPHNASDIAFAEHMVPHHNQAMELAQMVDGHATNPAVLAMAARISAQQQPEVAALTALLAQWNAADSEPRDRAGGDNGMNMQGMVDSATMAKLDTLTGPAFDTLWLQSMIGHHQGAIAMAKTEIANGKNSDMIAMANNIVVAQQQEIDQMKQILGG